MYFQKRALLSRSWLDLPKEIISKIETCLDSSIDVSQLRSVCKNWRSSQNPHNISILSPLLPRTFSDDTLPFIDRAGDPVTLVARAVFLVKPLGSSSDSCDWLLTVEELVPGKLRILYPLSKDHVKHPPSNCPKYLDLAKFKVSQVAKSYGFKYESNGADVPRVRKVVLCSGSTTIVLFGGGTLIEMRLKSGNWSYVRHSIFSQLSDVICYGGNCVRAVDQEGNMHIIDHLSRKVVRTSWPKSVYNGPTRTILLESSGKLFAVMACMPNNSPTGPKFVICQLDEVQRKWRDVSSKTYCRKLLFICSDWSFFLYTCDLDLRHYSPTEKEVQYNRYDQKDAMIGDYVIFSKKYFGGSSGIIYMNIYEGASIDLGIGVVFINSERASFGFKSVCSATADLLWPPPNWFWPNIYLSTSEDEEFGIYSQNASPCRKEESSPSCKAVTANKQGLVANFTSVRNFNTPTIQNLSQNSSTVVFEGINIKSNLVPTLEQIWGKYGDIVKGSIIRNAHLIASSLESLATVVIILQSSSGRSLNKDQADYLSSALCDLQQMKFKVDWLVPFVEKALAVQKSKPLIDSLKDFRKAKAQAEEMKLKVLDELAKLDEVEEDLVLVSERLPALESMDFDQSLGDGLC